MFSRRRHIYRTRHICYGLHKQTKKKKTRKKTIVTLPSTGSRYISKKVGLKQQIYELLHTKCTMCFSCCYNAYHRKSRRKKVKMSSAEVQKKKKQKKRNEKHHLQLMPAKIQDTSPSNKKKIIAMKNRTRSKDQIRYASICITYMKKLQFYNHTI